MGKNKKRMRRLQQGLYGDGDRYVVRVLVDGRQTWETFGDLALARARLSELKARQAAWKSAGDGSPASRRAGRAGLPRVSIGEYMKRWIERRRAAVAAGRLSGLGVEGKDVQVVGVFRRFLEKKGGIGAGIDRIAGSLLRDYFEFRSRTVRPATVRGDYLVLRKMFGSAIEEGYLARNPASEPGVSPPPAAAGGREPVPDRLVSLAELRSLAADLTGVSLHILICGAEAGLRLNESLHLCIEDLDFNRGVLRVRGREEFGFRLKPRCSREIPMSPTLLAYLLDAAGGREAGLVCPGKAGKPYTRVGATHRFGRDCRALGIAVSPGMLRQSMLCALIESGASLQEARAIAGDSGVAAARRYLRAGDAGLEDAIRRKSERMPLMADAPGRSGGPKPGGRRAARRSRRGS